MIRNTTIIVSISSILSFLLFGCGTFNKPIQIAESLGDDVEIKETDQPIQKHATSTSLDSYPPPLYVSPTSPYPAPNPNYTPQPSRTPIVPNCASSKPSLAELKGDMNIGLALQLLYSDFYCVDLEREKVFIEQTKSGYWKTIVPMSGEQFEQNGLMNYLLITQTNQSVTIAIFKKVDGIWLEKTRKNNIFGENLLKYIPQGQLIQIGHDQYGVVFQAIYGGQGFSSSVVYLIPYAHGNLGDTHRFLLTASDEEKIILVENDEGELVEAIKKGWGYVSTINFVPNINSNFYNLKITSSGTIRSKNSKIIPYEEIRVFSLIGNRYVRQNDGEYGPH